MPKDKKKLFNVAKVLKDRKGEEDVNFRVVITGKGGVGKTTTTALLAHLFARDGYNVLTVDEDPQMNLPYALGLDREVADTIVPISQNLDYIEEKTGARPGTSWGLYLNLTPDISDVVDKFGVRVTDNISVLVMGTVSKAATGCLCPENALLDAVVKFISLKRGEVILMDTQAGVEHFGRALAKGFKHCVVVTEPTFNAVEVAKRTGILAKEIGIPNVFLLVNKVRKERDIDKVMEYVNRDEKIFDSIMFAPYDEFLLEVEPSVVPLLEKETPYVEVVNKLKEKLIATL